VSSPEDLVRVVLGPEGEVAVDLAGGAFGRGAWVHPRPECIRKAVPAGLCRALRSEVRTSAAALTEQLVSAAARRAQGLIIAARRTRATEAGATAVEQAVRDRRAELVLVATDARASSEFSWLEPLIRTGSALAFATKSAFGAWLGRKETALVAITDPGIAREVRKTLTLTMLDATHAPSASARQAISSEAG
jgi:predicted RNA-binding protein YlxR (DUF448 family)